MTTQYFYFTLGPVQTFVAQARRTRDFWAGSFVLSFLSSVAMAAVRQQGGIIEFPQPDDHYLSCLDGKKDTQQSPPKQGSVPNRFKASVDEQFKPEPIVAAVHCAWRELSNLVWQKDIATAGVANEDTKAIWDRQLASFWHINWVLTPNETSIDPLNSRKHWRFQPAADEPGVKCSLMEGLQELSGASRPGKDVRAFWQQLRQQSRSMMHDVREDEHLCAVALVKRRFAHYFPQLSVTLPSVEGHGQQHVHGWSIPTAVPSVAHLAAIPWLAAVAQRTSTIPAGQVIINNLERAMAALDAPKEQLSNSTVQPWQQISGQYLFEPALDEYLKAARQDQRNEDLRLLESIKSGLTQLRQLACIGQPSPFYAILLMDGDSLGIQMSDTRKQVGISQALNEFTHQVPDVIARHSGFLVYAGGDDVVAILPQPFVLGCAREIEQCYQQCFERVNQQQPSTPIHTSLSAAIEIAHYKTPLTRILQDGHRLLDDIAKEATGRDSLAIRVWKPGGLHAEWAGPWSQVPALASCTDQVAKYLQGELARSFFFKLEELITQLCLTETHGFNDSVIASLVRSAWVHTGNNIDSLPGDLDAQLLRLCYPVKRIASNCGTSSTQEVQQTLKTGALRLIQFLATENRSFLQPHSKETEVQDHE